MKTRVFRTLAEWREFRAGLGAGQSLGFVPTMGALHPGHLSLCQRSKAENDLTAVSIFVNPTQFNDPKDLERYPRTFERDLEMLSAAGVDYLLYPSEPELYPDGYRYRLTESTFSRELCGAHRPGHFDGVLTVVLKLLNLVRADRAYFGEKDFQQLKLIEDMAAAFFLQTKIVPCPILREEDGVAMSSRNVRLTPDQRERAATFATVLAEGPTATRARERLISEGFDVDYVEEKLGRRLAAIRLGEVRLIDNVVQAPEAAGGSTL